VCLEQVPLSLVSTIEELFEIKSSGSGPKTENTAVGIRHADQKLALILPTSGGRSVGIVLSLTNATEFILVLLV
jgi:hypothetical protein